MNARDRVRKAVANIGIGVSFRATDLPVIHNIHDILSSLYDNDELELVSFEVHVRGHQKYERRIYAATETAETCRTGIDAGREVEHVGVGECSA